jgi:hypothetical protein
MNKILAILLLTLPLLGFGQFKHKGKAGLKVVETSTQSILGRCWGYYVVFENKSNKTIDGIKWTATFTNNFGEVLGVRNGDWQSGNLIGILEPGQTTEDIESNYVKGGLKIWITITKVHFVE